MNEAAFRLLFHPTLGYAEAKEKLLDWLIEQDEPTILRYLDMILEIDLQTNKIEALQIKLGENHLIFSKPEEPSR